MEITQLVVCLVLLSAVHLGLAGHLGFHGNQLFMLALSPTGNLYSQKQAVRLTQSKHGKMFSHSVCLWFSGVGAYSLVLRCHASTWS